MWHIMQKFTTQVFHLHFYFNSPIFAYVICHDSSYTHPDINTNLHMEKVAYEIYKKTMFYDVQDDIIVTVNYYLSVTIVCLNDISQTYMLRDIEFSVHK